MTLHPFRDKTITIFQCFVFFLNFYTFISKCITDLQLYSGRKGNAYEEVAEEEHEEVDNDISQEEKKTLILGRGPTKKHENIDDNLEESFSSW